MFSKRHSHQIKPDKDEVLAKFVHFKNCIKSSKSLILVLHCFNSCALWTNNSEQKLLTCLGPMRSNITFYFFIKQVVLEDDNTIHFGEVSCGAKQCRPIHLINRGRAQVPIRIILSAVSSLIIFNQFTRLLFQHQNTNFKINLLIQKRALTCLVTFQGGKHLVMTLRVV